MPHVYKLSVSFSEVQSIEPVGHASTGGPGFITLRDSKCEVTLLASDIERAYAVIQTEKKREKKA